MDAATQAAIEAQAQATQAQIQQAQVLAAQAAATNQAYLNNTLPILPKFGASANPQTYTAYDSYGNPYKVSAAQDAANEAAKYASFNNPIDYSRYANVPLSQMPAGIASRVQEYYRQNPSERFQSEIGQYGIEHNATVGSSGTMYPNQGGYYNYTKGEQFVPTVQEPVQKPSQNIISNPLSGDDTYFTMVSKAIQNTPGLSFIYKAGQQFGSGGRASELSTTLQNSPLASPFYQGGQVFEARQNAGYKAQQAATLYQSDVDAGIISGGKFVGTPEQYSNLQNAQDAATAAKATDTRLEAANLAAAVPFTMPLALWGIGASKFITDTGSSLIGAGTAALPIAAPAISFGVGVWEGIAMAVPFLALAPAALEWSAINPDALALSVIPGGASQIASMTGQAVENPFRFGGNIVGQTIAFKGLERGYEAQPYRFGIERADIISSSGEGEGKISYSSLAITKASGASHQIDQILLPTVGISEKAVGITNIIRESSLLKTDINAKFDTRMNVFSSPSEAMNRFAEVSGGGSREFYHATLPGDFVQEIINKGSVTVGKGNREGALFFAQPDTILTQFASKTENPIAIRLTATPKITGEYTNIVNSIRSGRTEVFGKDFAKASGELSPGFYPGLRAAAGKSYAGVGLEEEYIVAPDTTLYFRGARTTVSPEGRQWTIVDVGLSKSIVPDVKFGIAKGISRVTNTGIYAGIPDVPGDYFNFGGKETTFAAQTPLETSIVKALAPEEAPKIDLGYKVREITSGSGMQLQNATTAIGEVVEARGFPNPDKVTEAILQTEIDYGVKMYGSAIQKGVGTEQEILTMTRPPNDIDVFVPSRSGQPFTKSLTDRITEGFGTIRNRFSPQGIAPEDAMGQSFAEDVTTAINKAAGKQVVTIDESGSVILTDESGKLFDIHNENPTTEELLAQGSNPLKKGTDYYGIGMKPEKFISSTEGVEVMSYSEQIGRKLSGTSEFTFEPRTVISKAYEGGPEEFSFTGRIGPRYEGRMKDIADFYVGEKGNIQLMGRSINPITKARAVTADAYLEQWLNQWGVETAAKSIRENYQNRMLGEPARYSIDLAVQEQKAAPGKSSVGSPLIAPSGIIAAAQGRNVVSGSQIAGAGSAKPTLIFSEPSEISASIEPASVSAGSNVSSPSGLYDIQSNGLRSTGSSRSVSARSSPVLSMAVSDSLYPSEGISGSPYMSERVSTSVNPSGSLGESPSLFSSLIPEASPRYNYPTSYPSESPSYIYDYPTYTPPTYSPPSGPPSSPPKVPPPPELPPYSPPTTVIIKKDENNIIWERSRRRGKPARFMELFSFEEGATSPIPTRFGLGGVNARATGAHPARFMELLSLEQGTTSAVPARFGLGGVNTFAQRGNPKALFIPGYRGYAGNILNPDDIAPNGLFDIQGHPQKNAPKRKRSSYEKMLDAPFRGDKL